MTRINDERLNRITNVAIIIAALALVALVVYRFIPTKNQRPRILQPQVGQTVPLPKPDQTTLVAVLQTSCHFCDESMPFYKKLLEQGRPIIFVLPQKVNEATVHLANAGIANVPVSQASLESMHTSATPTLLLVDNSNHIQKVWIGLLDSERQDEVEASLPVIR